MCGLAGGCCCGEELLWGGAAVGRSCCGEELLWGAAGGMLAGVDAVTLSFVDFNETVFMLTKKNLSLVCPMQMIPSTVSVCVIIE
jgi:hypothetical protein